MKRSWALALLGAAFVLLFPVTAVATRTVHIDSSVSFYRSLAGKVSSPNKACAGQRKVVVKYHNGAGQLHVYARETTDTQGNFTINHGAPLRGQVPYRFFAIVKTRSEGTAGTIYVCDSATSNTRVVTGG